MPPPKKRRRTITKVLAAVVAYLPLSVAYLAYSGQLSARDWRTASRESAGLAPDPATTREAVIQVYSARAVSWRGWFGVHTWIAVKPRDASEFTVHEVMGWRLKRTGTALVARNRPADGYWYGARPELLGDIRGPGVEAIIDRIDDAVKEYPYPNTYHVWPGPNSNTFVAFVLRRVPELRVDMPPTAIGKDYLGWQSVNTTPSGTGGQVNLVRPARGLRGARRGPRGQPARSQLRRGSEEPVDQTTDRGKARAGARQYADARRASRTLTHVCQLPPPPPSEQPPPESTAPELQSVL